MGRRTVPKRRSSAARRPYRVFISHATADKWVARVICEKLDALGAVTFRDDRDIRGGDDIPDEIRREISRCDEIVVLMSPESVGRVWVILEIGMALARNRRIVPLLYHVDIDPIPSMIRSKKAYNLNDMDRYLADVLDRVKRKGESW